jgi:putative phosphotransacetylase
MNNPVASGTPSTAAMDQEILNRIVKEVFERLGQSGGGPSPLDAPQISHDHGVAGNPRKIPVGVSVRHIHICKKDLATLFGEGAELHEFRELYQKGEFAAQETVSLVGPKMRVLEKVRILGPTRDRTQVELARTDAIFLGVDAPLRMSGDIAGSSPITLIGPKGVVELSEGCIRAMRHVHMNPREAAEFNLKNGDIVKLRVGGPSGVTFENVVIRVSDKVRLQVHLDTDEGNVADVHCNQEVEIIKD